MELTTSRLRLRQWRDEDLEPFVEMSRDPEVMAHFPALLTREQAEATMRRIRAGIEIDGFGFWAAEVIGGAPFIGFCGLHDVTFDAPFTPAVEVGWRLARSAWGHGYATEGARAAIDYAFETLGLADIVAFLLPANTRSAAVCERLGMTRDPSGDFDHPLIPDGTISVGGYPQRRHSLYRLAQPVRT